MENITFEAFIFVMVLLLSLAIYMGVTEDRRRKEDPSEHTL